MLAKAHAFTHNQNYAMRSYPNIPWHSEIWAAADKAVLILKSKSNCKNIFKNNAVKKNPGWEVRHILTCVD